MYLQKHPQSSYYLFSLFKNKIYWKIYLLLKFWNALLTLNIVISDFITYPQSFMKPHNLIGKTYSKDIAVNKKLDFNTVMYDRIFNLKKNCSCWE